MFSRMEKMIGAQALEKLKSAKVAVFGLGGVGSYVVEALARCGVGELLLVDNDKVHESNINRQLFALQSTLGAFKTQVAKARVLDINPQIKVHTRETFVLPENIDEFDFTSFDYIVDAIDTVSAKLALIEKANACNTPIICAMGTGNKLNATAFEVTDISKTSVCPLARVMRRELKKRGIERLKVVYSKEEPIPLEEQPKPPASIAFVPSVAGLILAGEVVKDLIK